MERGFATCAAAEPPTSPAEPEPVVQQFSRPEVQQQPDPDLMSSSKGESSLDKSWRDEPAQQDDEVVLGAKSVILETTSWYFTEEEVHSNKNGSSDGASSSEGSDATWSGPPAHQVHPGKCLPGRAWRRGAILGVEHPFDRGKRVWRAQRGG